MRFYGSIEKFWIFIKVYLSQFNQTGKIYIGTGSKIVIRQRGVISILYIAHNKGVLFAVHTPDQIRVGD